MRTPWFPPSVKPVHPGYYETSSLPGEYHLLDYWDGKRWFDGKNGTPYIISTRLYWRGLTEKAK